MPDAAAMFAAHAATYDAARRALIPPFDRFYGAAVQALELAGPPVARVLDLGAGTGLLSGMVAAAHPGAELVLVDGAPAMLDRARERLREHPAAAYVVADLRDGLPPGPFDAVVSALAIHHLPDADKRALLGRILAALRPGGVFSWAEQVAGPTPDLERRYVERWIARCRAAGVDEDALAESLDRQKLDLHLPEGPQLAWLAEAGFGTVDLAFKDERFAVLVAVR
jgi:tRNA (cmo5U34)-methyltransferase